MIFRTGHWKIYPCIKFINISTGNNCTDQTKDTRIGIINNFIQCILVDFYITLDILYTKFNFLYIDNCSLSFINRQSRPGPSCRRCRQSTPVRCGRCCELDLTHDKLITNFYWYIDSQVAREEVFWRQQPPGL